MIVQNHTGIYILVSLKFSNSQICTSGNEHQPIQQACHFIQASQFFYLASKEKTLQQYKLRKNLDLVQREEGNYVLLLFKHMHPVNIPKSHCLCFYMLAVMRSCGTCRYRWPSCQSLTPYTYLPYASLLTESFVVTEVRQRATSVLLWMCTQQKRELTINLYGTVN